MKFKILQSEDKQFYCIIEARNGQVLFTSETYKRKEAGRVAPPHVISLQV